MLHLHWYRTVANPNHCRRLARDRYAQCRCGKRKWTSMVRGGYWPVDHDWLDGQGTVPWDRPMPPPPRTPSGYQPR